MKTMYGIKLGGYLGKALVLPLTAVLLFSGCQNGTDENGTSISYKPGDKNSDSEPSDTDTSTDETGTDSETQTQVGSEACLEEVYADGSNLNACVACHVDSGIADGTDLKFKASNASYNYVALKEFLEADSKNSQLLIDKISNDSSLSHFGGKFSANDLAYYINFVEAYENQDACTLVEEDPIDTNMEDTNTANTDTDLSETETNSGDSDTSNLKAWMKTSTYTAGDKVIYNAKVYEAKWWSKGDVPGAATWGPWKEIGVSNNNDTDTDTTTENNTDTSLLKLPGRIEAEKYTAFKDTTSGNSGGSYRNDDVDIQESDEGGFNIGWTVAGEWLAYDVNVETSATYTFTARVASSKEGTRSFYIELDGVNVTGTMNFPSTNAWQSYIDVVSKKVAISKGKHTIKIHFLTDGTNLNYINLTKEQEMNSDFTTVASHIFQSKHNSKGCIAAAGFPNQLAYTDCKTVKTQLWEEDTLGMFHNAQDPEYCLTASALKNYGELSASLCDEKNIAQRWVYKNEMIYNGGFSIDLDVKNQKAIVYASHGGTNQKWSEFMGLGGTDSNTGNNTDTGNSDTNTDNNTDTGNSDTNTDSNTDTGNTDTNTDSNTDTSNTDTNADKNTDAGSTDTNTDSNTDTGSTDTNTDSNTDTGNTNSENNEACMQDIFEKKAEISQCVVCHSPNGPANNTSLIFTDERYKSLKNFLDASTSNGDYLLDKITADSGIAHIGGKHSDSVIGFFSEFMDAHQNQGSCQMSSGNSQEKACDESPAPRHIRMLSADEYKNSMKDLTGYSVDISDYPLKIKVKGFDTISDTDALSSSDIDYFLRKASSAAKYIINNKVNISECSTNSCAKDMIESFGEKVYRKELTYSEVNDLYEVFTHESTKDDFKKGKELVIKAMLTSPYFLYRFELGESQGDGTYKLSQYEIASALSYQFLGTTPDATLLKAAKDKKLSSSEQLLSQARRLMQDERAKDQVAHFAQLWLQTDDILSANKNSASFTNTLRISMHDEVDTFIKHVVFNEGISNKFDELYNADYALVNSTLASHYGLSGSNGSAFVKVSGKGERGGILGLGALQAVQAHANESSPIKRGVFVRENLLCQDLPQPPADQEVTPPGLDPSLTTRERFAAHTDDQACKTCHVYIDDVGFGFERYDELGRYRENENGSLFVSDIGKLVGEESLDDKTSKNFNGVLELSTIVSNTQAAQECFATQYFRFSKGYIERSDDSCSIDIMYDKFKESNFDLKELFIQSVTLKSFTIKK